MKSVIKQLYNGDLCLSERMDNCVSEFRNARDIAVQAHDSFEDKLCQSMKIELDKLFSKDSDVNVLYFIQYFVDGFKMGAKLMLEILEVSKDD